MRRRARNLQAAIAYIIAFQQRFPEQDVWINFDSDNYINPWFKDTQWYDYNPKSLRQFREWLTGTGAYSANAAYSNSGLNPPLGLIEINKIAKQRWATLQDIDPPRGPLDLKDPWYHLWVRFKRHLVARHYTDLSHWACEAGMSSERVYTAVGISDGTVPKGLDDPLRGWNDQSGVSLAGGRPACGHLGVVMYGPGSRNESPTPEGTPLIDQIAAIDPKFGVVEFHPANLDLPNRLPTREESRKSLEVLLSAGMTFLSPMWGNIASGQTLFPNQFHAYEAMEGTAFEMELVSILRDWNAKHRSQP